MMAAVAEQIPTTVVGILGVLVAGLIAVIVLLIKTLGEARQAKEAFGSSEGPTLTANVNHLVTEVDNLIEAQRDFASRGWQTLPEPINTAAGLATTLSNMQHDITEANTKLGQVAERLAAHDAWERSQKTPPH